MSPPDQALARKQLPPSVAWARKGCNIYGPDGLSSDGAINTVESKLLANAQALTAINGHAPTELLKPSQVLVREP